MGRGKGQRSKVNGNGSGVPEMTEGSSRSKRREASGRSGEMVDQNRESGSFRC